MHKVRLLLLLLTIAFVANATAQAQNGIIKGVVKDLSNHVIPGVTITLANIDTKQEYKVQTMKPESIDFRFLPEFTTSLPIFQASSLCIGPI